MYTAKILLNVQVSKFALWEVLDLWNVAVANCCAYNTLAYLNGSSRNSPFAGVLKVKNGTRSNFICRYVPENNCNNSYIGWHVGYTQISTYRNKNETPYYYVYDVHQQSDGACVHEFNMTVILNFTSNGMSQSNVIYFKQSHDSFVTYKICSKNMIANYIMVILESENPKETTSCK